jgi:hypothetical protein
LLDSIAQEDADVAKPDVPRWVAARARLKVPLSRSFGYDDHPMVAPQNPLAKEVD